MEIWTDGFIMIGFVPFQSSIDLSSNLPNKFFKCLTARLISFQDQAVYSPVYRLWFSLSENDIKHRTNLSLTFLFLYTSKQEIGPFI